MAEPITQYRIMILYMLDRAEYPLTTTRITDCILEKDYTNYFTVQETIKDLVSSDLVITKKTHSNTLCRLTEEGRKTLHFFSDKISPEIKEEINAYFIEHKVLLREEASLYADYYRAAGSGWDVRCTVKNSDVSLLNLTLHVATEEQAQAVCANWKKESADVYATLMDHLLK